MYTAVFVIIGIVFGICLTIVIRGFMPKKDNRKHDPKKKGKLK